MKIPGTVTDLLRRIQQGDRKADQGLYRETYDELRAIARRLVRRERAAPLSPTELVNEAYLRKLHSGKYVANDRHHFYAIAARAMRSVLVEFARERMAAKRNHGRQPESLDGLSIPAAQQDPTEILALDELLDKFEKVDAAAARVFSLRHFLGYTLDETAAILAADPVKVREDWEYAKAWLRDRIDQTRSRSQA